MAEMVRMNQFPPIAFLFRRSAWEELGGFAEDLPVLGDWDFNLRFIEARDIGVIASPLARYHHRTLPAGVNASYGNSVHTGDRHDRYDAVVRNRMLRRDLEAGKLGMGALVTLGRLEHGNREIVFPAALMGARIINKAKGAFAALGIRYPGRRRV